MKNIINLENKTILVTGASSGIGNAICKEISGYGAKVVMVARREDKLKKTLADLEGEGHRYYTYDLSDIDGIEDLMKRIVDQNGKLDGFVHSAGVGITRGLNMTRYEEIHNLMLINFYAFIEFVRMYAKKKNNNGGSVVAISSKGSVIGEKAKVAYSSSKAAVDSAIRCMAAELKSKNIRVNSVQPGWVKTDMYKAYMNRLDYDAKKRFHELNPLVEPEDIASVVAFLLSDAARAVTGCSVATNWGMWKMG